MGEYLEEQNLAIILDINYDFKPWRIERNRLFTTMDTLDRNKKRGFLRVERSGPHPVTK